MPKTLSVLLFTTPYVFGNTGTVLKLAEAALEKGYAVNVSAYGDGVHNFTVGQRAKGVPHAEEGFKRLLEKGLNVELCGTCLAFRGIGKEIIMEGARPSSMRGLCEMIKGSDVFVSFAF
ncbi:MAG: DsrE family protein [Candidatus Bathyarchaeia archaeon]